MDQNVTELLGRRGPIRDVPLVPSGSPADLTLRPAGALADVKTISAIRALAQRGMTLRDAKHAIETMVETGEGRVHVPTVEDPFVLGADLVTFGVRAMRVADAPSTIVEPA
jgi:hypothetical protein